MLQLVNNVVVIRRYSDLILVDAGTGPRHQLAAGKLAENLGRFAAPVIASALLWLKATA